MNGLIWIGQVALACVFLALGTLKIFAYTPLMQAIASRTHVRVAEAPISSRILGVVEVVLAFGVLMPDVYASDGMVPEFFIVRSCAAGLALVMIGTAIYHMRRKEHASFDIAMFLLALFVIVGRWPF